MAKYTSKYAKIIRKTQKFIVSEKVYLFLDGRIVPR